MHIVIVTRNMLSGGAERVIAQLLNEWSNLKIQCDLLLLENVDCFYKIPEDVVVHNIGKLSGNNVVNKIKQYNCIRKLIKKISPDIVLSMPEEIGIYVIGAMLGTRIPVVISERNDPWVMPNKKITRLLRRLTYPFAKGIIFQTEKAAEFFSDRIKRKSIILSNPLDISRIPKQYIGKRTKTVVGVGRLVEQKNFRLLIDAFYDFYEKHKEYRLIIYGEGVLRCELEEYSRKLPYGVVELPGVSDNLLEEIKSASMFVLSSDYEGVPNALIEAMSMGMPVVAADCSPGGASLLIDNGINGLIVPVGDKAAMSSAMNRIADEPVFAVSIADEAAKIKERFDSAIVAKEWIDYLKKCGSVVE